MFAKEYLASGSTGKHRWFPWREKAVNQFTRLEMRREWARDEVKQHLILLTRT